MTMTVKVSAISNELHYREMFSFHQILISGSDNRMIDYNRSSDRKGFDLDVSIPKFGIDYDRNKQQRGCVLTRLPGRILTKFFAQNKS